ncbi:mycofactocin-coupled SDR family oxidoreductase [Actinomadura sp. LD22]|uniref:Mycofactocin-coupled SDR family oxidoreductase n=1 Tax=Actinomadura physcomitrii TaxID=2650748 RepID=A0A6I4M8A4_9ACTN|nr:mycofactocin-coupled SDR family oxidoreductase [Actinomadura physcomitrii]MWA02378.1 mycofactocin-coupled SDR family oxidoreductase [Actinomadura physcomitrii]MWA03050.1 mycofactocin-coupled SDR family oxidoreductase [Actinomadura physcomitrii]
MTGSLEGRVAFITGAARGQGRAHAVRLAREGVDIIGLDICKDIASFDYSCATREELEETAALVAKEGRTMVTGEADVRDLAAVKQVFEDGYARLGRIDIVIANAGMIRYGAPENVAQEWQDTLDVILTGAFNTVQASIDKLIEGGNGGSIVLVSSSAGLKGTGSDLPSAQAYTAAKRGLVGYMQVLAQQYAEHSIRVNTIHPTGVVSGMTTNEAMMKMAADPNTNIAAMQNLLPIQILQPEDIANAVAYLVSDEAAFITGTQWALDAGFSVR